MQMGLLWFDGDKKKSAPQKIEDGRRRFHEKFEMEADTVHVNPTDKCSHPDLRVVVNKLVQPDHFWIGVEEQKAAELAIN